jgi:hypothetical protein
MDEEYLSNNRSKLEDEWAKAAKELGLVDFHQLDQCDCGEFYICETRKLTKKEAEEHGYPDAVYTSSWFCPGCDHTDYKYYDAKMNDLN